MKILVMLRKKVFILQANQVTQALDQMIMACFWSEKMELDLSYRQSSRYVGKSTNDSILHHLQVGISLLK